MQIFILLSLILLFSCTSRNSEIKKNELIVLDDESTPIDSFKLILPDTVLINSQLLILPYSSLYIFLISYYDSLEAKQIEKFRGNYPVIFNQSFKYGINYSQKHSIGSSFEEITFPLNDESEIKKLFAVLYHSNSINWSSDSLLLHTEGFGGNGGCEFTYITNNQDIIVKIHCFD